MAILTADPGPEDEPARGDPGDVGELARHQHGMAQRKQVHAGMDGQHGMQHRQRGRLHQPVEPHPAEEAHMVPAADVVDAGRRHPRQVGPGCLRGLLEQAQGREHADSDRCPGPARSARLGQAGLLRIL